MSAGAILIVDDTPGNLDLLVDILEKHDYEVRVARSGRRALTAVAAAPPELVMLDINMPDMDGYEVCRRLKAAEATREIPVIFLSVNDDADDKVRAFHAGGADYVIKPFQAEEVLARVENQFKIWRLQRDLVTQREAAYEASRAKSVFLASMSHELRTPLNGILGFVQLMERDAALTPAQREHLGVIARSGEHLLALINDVLALSKIEAGQATLNERPFDLGRLLRGIEEMFRVRAVERGLRLVFDLAPSLPASASGDDGKLRQILINLLGNAFKFTDAGGVALRAAWADGVARFEVEDTGHGIAAAEVERIFEPFVQTETGARTGEGTGLGLTITRNFVALMGGRVSVRSEVGRGTTFAFDVKLAAARGDARPASRRIAGLALGEPARRVLVVADADEDRRALVDLLAAIGLEVREAATGRDAIGHWSEWTPHLVFVDARVLEADGREATREIRRLEAAGAPRCAIVALSASVFERDRREFLLAGCDDFVGTPFRREALVAKIVEHLGVRFRYETAATAASSSGAPPAPAVAPERFAGVGSEHRARLQAAVTAGDREAAFLVADEIAALDAALADDLRSLVKAYRFDDILDIVEER
jgi:signal transduction histidine kinase